MKLRHTLPLAAAVLGLSAPLPAAYSAPPAMFPFVIPWDDASKGVSTDVSFLNACPAGVNGYIVVKDGHFAESKTGQRIRFLGTNLTFESNFPPHSDAEKTAAHMAKLGINIVRIHHQDANDGMLWDKSAKGHTKFDPAAVDRLDYLIAQLKKNGIYVDLNLHVSRKFTVDDGFPESITKIPGDARKRIDHLDRHMIDLQKQFAKDYLTHINQYTGLSYTEDPTVAMVEINNENSFIGWHNEGMGYFNALPEPFHSELVAAWNDWLFKKYHTTSQLRESWWAKLPPANAPMIDYVSSTAKWSIQDQSTSLKLTQGGPGTATTAPDLEVTNPSAVNPAPGKQVVIAGLTLPANQPVTVTFRAKASTPVPLRLNFTIDHGSYHYLGDGAVVKLGTDWKEFNFMFAPQWPEDGHNQVSIPLGDVVGSVQISDFRIHATSMGDIASAPETLETRTIELPSVAGSTQASDWREFEVQTDTAYADEMRAYLRRDLKVHALLVDSQIQFGGNSAFSREAGSDFIDYHGYWNHPEFPGGGWSGTNWIIKQSPLTDHIIDVFGLGAIATSRVIGKPFTVTEYNEPAPSDYQSEMFPEIASYAAYQDWDAIFGFDYGGFGASRGNDKIDGFFAMRGNPAKEAFLPAAALIFRAAQIAPCASKATLHLAASELYFDSRQERLWRDANGKKNVNPLDFLYSFLVDPVAKENILEYAKASGEPKSLIRSVTGSAGSQYIAKGDGAIAGAGFFGGQTVDFGAATISFPEFGNNFASLALVALDGKSVTQSSKMLLTVIGKAENLEMGWNADRTSVGWQWGHGPVQAEGIPATLTLASDLVHHVWALSPTGQRVREVPVTVTTGKSTFVVGPEYGTIWYEFGS